MAVPIALRNTSRYGNSQVHEFQFNMLTNKWFADFYWQRYDGFFLTRSWLKLPLQDVHPQRKGLSLKNSGASFTYIFNHGHYSMRSAYQFSERQMISAGSFMLGFSMNRFRIFGDGFIIRPEDQTYFAAGSDARSTDFVSAAMSVGYGYTHVYKSYFVNVTALAGPTHFWMKYNGSATHYDIDLNLNATFMGAIGYNGERAFMGVTFNARNSHAKMQATSISNTLSTFRAVAGFRLMERGLLTKRPKDLIRIVRTKK